MIKTFSGCCRTCALILGLLLPGPTARDGRAAESQVVPFEELQRLVREHLADASDEELNAAAVRGLIDQLRPHVLLGAPAPSTTGTNDLIMAADRYRQDFARLRIGDVRDDLAGALRVAIDKVLEEGPLKGLVLDLRGTGGGDYAAAARAAAMFTETEGALLRVGNDEYAGTPGGDPVLIPVMTLTNGETAGAAEALAAALRSVKAGLIIGSRTAGKATLYEEFKLSNGDSVRIASQPVQLADGKSIPRTGLTPDIQIVTTLEEDRQYLANPYWEPAPMTPRNAVPRRRITEADLVRQRREGIPLERIIADGSDGTNSVLRTLQDPALLRALDMLKALTVVQTWRKESE
jgi:hypothetical protein